MILEPWQQFVVGSVFGWLREDGTRRFRTVYEEIPRKNGKSTKLAGIGLLCLIADQEMGAEVYAAATKKDQARIIFDEARRMVRYSPELGSRIGVFKNNMSIDATASKFEPLSSDEKTLDGLNPHAVLIDELHKHKSRAVLDVLDTALGARRQPLLWEITTAGDDDPTSVYASENDYAIKVLERALDDDNHFAFIATIDRDDRWDDPVAWEKANPNLHVSVKLDDLKRQAQKAARSPTAQSAFKRLRLNVRGSTTNRLIDASVWARNTEGPFDPESLHGRKAFAALDLSSKIDLSALVLLFPPIEANERWKVTCRFWMPSDTVLDKQDRDRAHYQLWIDRGWIEVTPGNVIDHGAIESVVLETARHVEIIGLGYDPWNATQLATRLQDQGLHPIEFVQGLRSYTAPTKELLAMLLADKIEHGGNPVLGWMAMNLMADSDKNENLMPSKKRSTGRIDGMTALIMALGLWMTADTSESRYNSGAEMDFV